MGPPVPGSEHEGDQPPSSKAMGWGGWHGVTIRVSAQGKSPCRPYGLREEWLQQLLGSSREMFSPQCVWEADRKWG